MTDGTVRAGEAIQQERVRVMGAEGLQRFFSDRSQMLIGWRDFSNRRSYTFAKNISSIRARLAQQTIITSRRNGEQKGTHIVGRRSGAGSFSQLIWRLSPRANPTDDADEEESLSGL